jgi:hypothetical protein
MKITFKELTNIPAAVALKLSPEQVAARTHALEHYGDVVEGAFVGTETLQFKAGETVEIIGDLPKGILPIYDQLNEGLMTETEINELEFETPPPEIKTSHKKPKNVDTAE